jgi:hypothetical protein
VRYVDTGTRDYVQTLGAWLETSVAETCTGVWIQTGYFGFEGIAIHAHAIGFVAARGHPVHFVIGANQSSLAADDVRRLAELLVGSAQGAITVVAYANGLFHPKAYVVRDHAGDYRAYVGSANLTGPGVGLNVEAGITLSCAEGDDRAQICLVAGAIEAWAAREADGAFHVRQLDDVNALLEAGVLAEALPHATRPATRPTGPRATGPGRRTGTLQNLYPTAPLAPLTVAYPAPPTYLGGGPLSWSKVMASSDAQYPDAGTNPTGKLRLSKAGHAVDHKTWFRESFFDGMPWVTQMRSGKPYEVAHVPFRVTMDGVDLGVQVLLVDHAPHRVAGQNNVPTVLSWGGTIGSRLAASSHIGRTVTLQRDGMGRFTLAIA